jgi:hypothetical protein
MYKSRKKVIKDERPKCDLRKTRMKKMRERKGK